MPREVVVLSRSPFDQNDRTVVEPAIARGLGIRSMQDGAVVQWCRADGTAVLSLLGPREMDDPAMAALQLGEEPAPEERYWCEGTVPFGQDRTGIEVLREMAAAVGGRVWVGGE